VGDEQGTTTNGVSTDAASDASDRAAFLAEMAGKGEPAKDADKPAREPKGDEGADDDLDQDEDADETSADADDDDADLDDAEEGDEDEDDDKADDEDKAADEPKDADTVKRRAAIQKAERRAKEQIARDAAKANAELDARVQKIEAEWGPRIAKAEKFEQLADLAKNPYQVADVLRELGLSEDDFEAASQTIFAHSKKFASDPKGRETVAKLKSERELREEVAQLKKAQAERDAAEAKRDAEARATQRGMALIESTLTLKLEKTPLAAKFIAQNPDRARREIAAIAGRLMDETGEFPTPKSVRIQLEKDRRQVLRDLGIDPKSAIQAAAKDEKKGDKVDVEAKDKAAKKPAKPNGKTSDTTNGKDEKSAELSYEEEREEFLRWQREQRSSDD
jgi:hypothetical protein